MAIEERHFDTFGDQAGQEAWQKWLDEDPNLEIGGEEAERLAILLKTAAKNLTDNAKGPNMINIPGAPDWMQGKGDTNIEIILGNIGKLNKKHPGLTDWFETIYYENSADNLDRETPQSLRDTLDDETWSERGKFQGEETLNRWYAAAGLNTSGVSDFRKQKELVPPRPREEVLAAKEAERGRVDIEKGRAGEKEELGMKRDKALHERELAVLKKEIELIKKGEPAEGANAEFEKAKQLQELQLELRQREADFKVKQEQEEFARKEQLMLESDFEPTQTEGMTPEEKAAAAARNRQRQDYQKEQRAAKLETGMAADTAESKEAYDKVLKKYDTNEDGVFNDSEKAEVLKDFDDDGDGILNESERADAGFRDDWRMKRAQQEYDYNQRAEAREIARRAGVKDRADQAGIDFAQGPARERLREIEQEFGQIEDERNRLLDLNDWGIPPENLFGGEPTTLRKSIEERSRELINAERNLERESLEAADTLEDPAITPPITDEEKQLMLLHGGEAPGVSGAGGGAIAGLRAGTIEEPTAASGFTPTPDPVFPDTSAFLEARAESIAAEEAAAAAAAGAPPVSVSAPAGPATGPRPYNPALVPGSPASAPAAPAPDLPIWDPQTGQYIDTPSSAPSTLEAPASGGIENLINYLPIPKELGHIPYWLLGLKNPNPASRAEQEQKAGWAPEPSEGVKRFEQGLAAVTGFKNPWPTQRPPRTAGTETESWAESIPNWIRFPLGLKKGRSVDEPARQLPLLETPRVSPLPGDPRTPDFDPFAQDKDPYKPHVAYPKNTF